MTKLEASIHKTQKELNELTMLINAWDMCDYSSSLDRHMDIGDQIALHKIINTLKQRLEDIQEKVNAI
jgi:hypothetical protein